MPEKTVLFVDDEPRILQGLRRMLHPLSREWNLLFADSGEAAMRLLEQTDVTAVVSDMRMPGMNGFTLLRSIGSRYPHIVRVLLTGQPDKEMYCDVMAMSHYFLWKPAQYQDLKKLLETIGNLSDTLGDQRLRQIIGGIRTLPVLPSAFQELTALMDNPDSRMEEVVAILERDISMAAQILKLVNSAYFGLSRRVSTLKEAISFLGLDILRQLVLMQHLFARIPESEVRRFRIDRLWQHSFCTATLAKDIIENSPVKCKNLSNVAYLAGLLHDIGKLVLFFYLPEASAEAREKLAFKEAKTSDETAEFGADHTAIGGYLTSLWGMPHAITEAVTMHHAEHLDETAMRISPVLAAVWHADRICRGKQVPEGQHRELTQKWRQIIDHRCDGSVEPAAASAEVGPET
jgi:HD-like signal output (HDOD) protein